MCYWFNDIINSIPLLNPLAISAFSVYVWLFILSESGKDDLSFIFPIAYFSIDQHFLELFLFSSRYVLKYIFFFFLFNLFMKHVQKLYIFTGGLMFSSKTCRHLCYISLVYTHDT